MTDEEQRINMGRAEEVLYAQERYQEDRAGAPAAAPPAVAPAITSAPPSRPRRGVATARLVAAGLALVLAAAFFYPAFHDAIRRGARILPLARDGRTLARPAPPRPDLSVYLSIAARPRGATVIVDGLERGNTPLVTNVVCFKGEAITVEIVAAGYAPWRAELTCARGPAITIDPSLARASRP